MNHEAAFLVGNGAGQPLGVLNAPAAIAQARQTAGAITFPDVGAMLGKLPPGSLPNGIFVCSPSSLVKLRQLADGSNRAVVIQAGVGDELRRPRFTLAGLPMFCCEWSPALGTKGDLMLIDPAYYVIGDRLTLELAAGAAPLFLSNRTALRLIRRVDGQPWIEKPITLQDGSTQVSPSVVLN